ncbi:MAG: hypothetical protein JNL80_04350 [Phycisphaerae bacterium]|jgi:hypothetical protein|nr:hypothetical protein [Phycisphaerae bacterium]
MSIDATQVLVWSIVSLVTAAVLYLIVRALFRDRSRGRRRCPRCWHDMQETPGLRCPECGSTVRSEARFFATRRHWRRATFLLIGLIVMAMVVRVQMTEENLFEYAPTWFLTNSLPYAPSSTTDPVTEALQARIARKALTPEQIAEVGRRIREGDASAPPTSLRWQSRYGVLLQSLMAQGLDALERGQLDDPALVVLESFRDLPPLATLTAPREWPAHEPLIVELAIDEWWPPMTYARVRVRDEHDGTERIMGLDSGGAAAPRYPFAFAPIGENETQRRFSVTVEARKTAPNGGPDPSQPWCAAHVSTSTLSLRRVEPIDLKPFSGKEADDAVRSVFARGLVAWRQGWRRYGLMFDASRTGDESFDGTLLGLDIELTQGDTVRRHSRIWWPAGRSATLARWEILFEDPEPLASLTTGSEGWSIRVRGRRDIAVRALASVAGVSPTATPFTRYWEGDVMIPLEVRVNENASPRRRWFALPDSDLPAPSTTPAAQD